LQDSIDFDIAFIWCCAIRFSLNCAFCDIFLFSTWVLLYQATTEKRRKSTN